MMTGPPPARFDLTERRGRRLRVHHFVTERTMQTATIAYSGGTETVRIGDQFFMDCGVDPHQRGVYKVVEITSDRIYSPSGLGGTRIVVGKHTETGQEIRFCADSVAMRVAQGKRELAWWNNHTEESRGTMLGSPIVVAKDHPSQTEPQSPARCYAVFGRSSR